MRGFAIVDLNHKGPGIGGRQISVARLQKDCEDLAEGFNRAFDLGRLG